MKTWDDVIQAALNDPILHQAVTLVERGDLTREQALIHAALALSQIREDQHKQLVGLISNRPPAPFILPK